MTILQSVQRPYSEVQDVGVVLHKTPHGQHTGFLYRRDDGSIRVLHLAFHHDLRDDEVVDYEAIVRSQFRAELRWGELGLPEDSKVVFAAHLSQVLLGNPQIPYGLDRSGVTFTADGALVQGPIGKGLTCATFIVAVLTGYGHPVVMDDWAPRAEDKAWAERIIALLRGRASQEHVDAIGADIGSARYRPGEVVGSAVQPEARWPISFPDAVLLAEEIARELA